MMPHHDVNCPKPSKAVCTHPDNAAIALHTRGPYLVVMQRAVGTLINPLVMKVAPLQQEGGPLRL